MRQLITCILSLWLMSTAAAAPGDSTAAGGSAATTLALTAANFLLSRRANLAAPPLALPAMNVAPVTKAAA